MTNLGRAIGALCGPSKPEIDELQEVLASAGLQTNVFVPDLPTRDERLIRACNLAAEQGYVLTDAQGNLTGRLVPQVQFSAAFNRLRRT